MNGGQVRVVRRLLAVLAVLAVLGLSSAGPAAAGELQGAAAPGPARAPEWWFRTWQVKQLWADGADGRGVTVAVLDTGVQANLPELAGHVVAGADFSGRGTDGRTDTDQQAFSHGTAMASLIVAGAGSTGIIGVAPGATVLPVVVPLTDEGAGTTSPGGTAAAIRYAADRGARIISMSFGGTAIDPRHPCPGDVEAAVRYALGRGSLLVAAAGNAPAAGQPGSAAVQPGACPGVLSVGAVSPDQHVSSVSTSHSYLAAVAPGDQIATLSRHDGAAYLGSGTSQATALAAGAAALVWSKFPAETNRQITARLLASATDAGSSGLDPTYGYGILDPAAAIAAKAPPRSAKQV